MKSKGPLERSHICRVCLENKSELFFIFDETFGDGGSPMSHILSECTRYKVERYDTLPHQICDECMGEALSAYKFKQRAETSYRKLLSMLDYDMELKMMSAQRKDTMERSTQTEKNTTFPCDLRGEKCFDVGELKAHRQEVHKGMAKSCKVCNKTFERLRELQAHLANEHPDDGRGLECRVCMKCFSQRDHLKRHLRNIHNLDTTAALIKEQTVEVALRKGKMSDTSGMYTLNWQHFGEEATIADNDYDKGVIQTTNPISSDDEDIGRKINADALIWPLLKFEPELEMKVEHDNIENDDKTSGDNLKKKAMDLAINLATVDTDESKVIEKPESKKKCKATASVIIKEKELKVKIIQKSLEAKKPSKRRRKGEAENNTCPKCMRNFSSHRHLQRHMLTHSEEKRHACPHCAKRFARSDHLKVHIVSLHGNKEFKCDQCSYAFSRPEVLIRHINMCHGGDSNASSVYKIHPCEYCDKKFISKIYLVKHTLMHTDRIFACFHCEETFRDRKEFRTHEKSHQTGRDYLCYMCGESFMRNDYLRVHMRRHTGEKPYKCKHCEKAFPRANDLNIHVKLHTGTFD